MRSRKIEPAQVKRALRTYNWQQLLIIPFDMNEFVHEAMCQAEEWILEDGVDWCEDDDDERDERPSYLILICPQSVIQGPVVYVLLAGTTDNVDTSVGMWNKSHDAKCIRIRFRSFGERQLLRRRAMLTFLRGLIDISCLAVAKLYREHELSDRELRAQKTQL